MFLIMCVIKLILEILFIKFLLIHQTDSFLIHLRDSVKPLLYLLYFFSSALWSVLLYSAMAPYRVQTAASQRY